MEKSIDDIIDLFEAEVAARKREKELKRVEAAKVQEIANDLLSDCFNNEILPALVLAKAKMEKRGYACKIKETKDVNADSGKVWFRSCGMGIILDKDAAPSDNYADFISYSIAFIPEVNRHDVKVQATVKGDNPGTVFTIMPVPEINAETVKLKIGEFLERVFAYHLTKG